MSAGEGGDGSCFTKSSKVWPAILAYARAAAAPNSVCGLIGGTKQWNRIGRLARDATPLAYSAIKAFIFFCSGVTTAERGTEKCCATAEHNNMLWAFVCPQHCLDPKKGEFCVNFPRFRKGFPCVLVQWSKIQRSTCA